MGITCPLIAVAFAVPIAVLVLVRSFRGGGFRSLLVFAAAATAVLALLFLWSRASTGSWSTVPYI
jgi:hypothetical protein